MWNLRQNLYWKKSKLNRHIVSVHEKVKKPFKCDICDHTYSFKSYLTFHVSSVYEKKKPFECQICDYACSQKKNMENHTVSAQDGNLKSHILSVHEKKKPFKCQICHLIGFSQKGDLKTVF